MGLGWAARRSRGILRSQAEPGNEFGVGDCRSLSPKDERGKTRSGAAFEGVGAMRDAAPLRVLAGVRLSEKDFDDGAVLQT